jgi:hypothetical protein
MISQYSWNMCLLINNTYSSYMMGHHFLTSAFVRQHQTFGEQWIGRGGPVNWLARSPDLNPLDFLLWGHLKSSVYSALICDLEVLEQRVEKQGIFDGVRTSLRRRAETCVEMHGNHTASAVEITRTLPIAQQSCVSANTLTVAFCSFK